MREQDYIISDSENVSVLKSEVTELLEKLISTPSYSREENLTGDLIEQFLIKKEIDVNRNINNVWCKNKFFDELKKTILLNSHHDTVKPNSGYTNNPFNPFTEEGKIFGLGSNDAGGPLMALLATFIYFYDKENLKYNFIFAATAEEEISGQNGIACLINDLPKIDFAIVGEPTQMQMAAAEKGLLVLDCKVFGKAGHAARNEGENAIVKSMEIINWFSTFKFPKISESLGEIKMSVTVIKAGGQHNVVPALCEFTVDVRTTDVYTNEEVVTIIKNHVDCEITPRSYRLQPSSISKSHPFVLEGLKLNRTTYGSPTLSDQALMPWPSLKMGPGDSARSHSANEFIYINEIEEAIDIYITILKKLN
ncbi:M20 family metallo-hydrolase [Sediminibacterium sp.]|uniref:M20 family metallo-hydrolase n=1 Tax=Sediminibacterium sp. TaxID=1917865 RepID=UPI002735C0DC|nr:M20 family metallo-hydrolase [Sediminibacterium sp.]MDP3567372.1 M20 family metallo-hydrolase [Sediminibacterium sp.]